MTYANIDLYRVLRGLGASEEDAERASAEGPKLRADIEALRSDVHDVRAELRLQRWMIGVNSALLLIVLGRLFGVVGGS